MPDTPELPADLEAVEDVRDGDFSSRDDLVSKIESYILGRNETAKPYRWTYDGTPLKAA